VHLEEPVILIYGYEVQVVVVVLKFEGPLLQTELTFNEPVELVCAVVALKVVFSNDYTVMVPADEGLHHVDGEVCGADLVVPPQVPTYNGVHVLRAGNPDEGKSALLLFLLCSGSSTCAKGTKGARTLTSSLTTRPARR
jgi:hypothetical protein